MSKLAFVFPGQGSQALKMMDGLLTLPQVQASFAEAADILGVDFLAMLQDETPERINQTINTQPLLLAASIATYRAWLAHSSILPDFVAGHSLGEYSALVASGVIEYSDALRLVRKRAEYMQEAVAAGVGAMAAVIGLADEDVTAACQEAASSSSLVVAAVNFNAPGQVVIAGHKEAVTLASSLLKDKGARKIIPLSVSVPSHCQLMEPAAQSLAENLAAVSFKPAQIQLVQNINATSTMDAQVLKDGLVKQLYLPVLWTQSVQTLATSGVERIVECGPGKVLTGLNKRIHASANLHNLQTEADLIELAAILG